MTLLYSSRSELAFPAFSAAFQVLIGCSIVSGALVSQTLTAVGPILACIAAVAWIAATVLQLRLLPWFLPGAFTLSASATDISLTGRAEVISFKVSDIKSIKFGYCWCGRDPDWTLGDWAQKSPLANTLSPAGYFIVFHVASATGRKTYGLALRKNQAALQSILRLVRPAKSGAPACPQTPV